ncbi:hypothetical protein D7Y41_02525 [Anaerotruncus sp. 1XD22-93]|nr:hypothetical protein [Lachnospiraceae bacterium]NBI74263.1 hypothetical protein [Lachnospiraceae bacterium]RKK00348.1 hypothetical protein D7Y41_02525 [Anaerotruncus sp. 1XD22-93]
MIILSEILSSSQKFMSAGECSIIIDGKFLSMQSSLVYAQMDDDNVCYYTKTTSDNIQQKIMLDDSTMESKYAEPFFCGKYYSFIPSVTKDNLGVDVDSELKIIFIETFMYKKIRELIVNDTYHDATMLVKGTEQVISNEDITEMVNRFKSKAYRNYLETAYTGKFLNRIVKARGNAFYSILRCFVPVAIECKYLYNPLLDNPAINFKSTRLYADAEQKGRHMEILPNGVLSTMLATHNEICESLGMSYMVRFTPQFLYELIVGFYTQGDADFPNVNTKVWRATSRNYAEYGLRPYYSMLQLAALLDSYKDKTGESQESSDTLEFLSSYTESDSLWCAIDRYRLKLIHYGAHVLDNKLSCTTNALYNYLSKASLF